MERFLLLPAKWRVECGASLYSEKAWHAARGVLAICAAPSVDHVPRELIDRCESVCWKGLSGFDFSAFAIALELLAEKSPGCDVFVMNDSVLGPFADVDAMVETGQWRLTGFTASSAFENHLQSYAWFLRDLTPDIPRKLISVMSSAYSFNSFQHVVNCQETRFARVASRFGSVGSLWFGNHASVGDPSLYRALPLLDGGFPFLKRSLLGGKLKHLHPQRELEQRLALLGHPPVISVVSDAR